MLMKYLIKYALKSGIWTFSLAALIGCGRWASAPEQEVVTKPIPEFPQLNSHVLSLQDGAATVGYGGTMLLFNENTTGELIAEVLQVSIDSRIAWAEARRFEEESRYRLLYTDTGIVPNALQDMRAELRRFQAEALANASVPLNEKKQNVKEWLPIELDRLYGTQVSDQRQRAELMLGYFCQAKVIELATNSFFAVRQYNERPTPLAFCESYYEEQDYFKSKACEADSRGRSYFECLWRDGVFKTHWFEDVYLNAELDANRADQIADLLSEEKLPLFRAIMALDEGAMVLSNTAIRRLVFGTNGDRRNYFSDIIMQQSKGTSACLRAIPDLTSLCSVFEIFRPSGEPQTGLTADDDFPLNPLDTISVIEERDASLANYFTFPLRRDSNASTKEILAFYGQRNLNNHRNSENDRHFHLPATGEALPRPDLGNRLLEKSSEVQAALTPTVYPELSEQNQIVYQARLGRIQQLEKDLQEARRINNELQDQITLTSKRGFLAGEKGDLEKGTQVAHAFVEIRLKVANRNGLVRAYFWTKDHEDHVTFGCYRNDEARALSLADCQPDPADRVNGKFWYPATTFSINPGSGQLNFGFEITTPSEQGLGYKARRTEDGPPDSFMDFQDSELVGKQLVFELFPNRVYEHLEILSGKAFIRQNGQDLYEAGVSLWDQNL